MDTIKKLSDYAILINSDIKFMGVPKTIDNDLAITDHTPGYGSAAKFIAASLKEIIRDGLVYDYPTITIVEIMGRNAGWLTAAAALSKSDDCEGVDMIYLPEKVFDIDEFMTQIKERSAKKKSLVIAVSEGIKVADDCYIYPAEYFCPTNLTTGRIHVKPNTRTIHHYAGSWVDNKYQFKNFIKKLLPEKLIMVFSEWKSKKNK